MANTYSSHGFLNFEDGVYTDQLNTERYISDTSVNFVEYTTDNSTKCRLLATVVVADLKSARVTLKVEKQIEVSAGVWVDSPFSDVKSSRAKFADSNGLEVDQSEALEDPDEDGVYTLKAGYSNEFDGVFIAGYYKGAGVISDYVTAVLANKAGVTIP